MPRIINAYDGNSAIGGSLAKLGESIYGDQAKNEVFRQKAAETKRENDNAEPFAAAVRDNDAKNIGYYGALRDLKGQDVGDYGRYTAGVAAGGNVDDPRLATAFMGAGGNFAATAPGQGRSLANDRSIAGGHDATSRANNADTLANNITTTGMTNQTSRDVADMTSKRQAETQLAIDGRTIQPVLQPDGSTLAYTKTDAASQHLPMPQSTDQLNAGITASMLRARAANMAPQDSAFTRVNANGPAPQNGGVSAGIYTGLTPQLLSRIGQKEQPMINPFTGKTGTSWDNGATLADGTPATGYVPASNEAVLAAEKANNVRAQAAVPLPPKPEGYSQYAQDAYTAGGPGGALQHDINGMKGLVGLGEFQPDTNRARENLTNTNNTIRSLYAAAPGTRAAVYRDKNANMSLPDPNNFLGITGINADQQRNRADSDITHLREQYALVQADAMNPQTPPEEAAKMLSWLHSARDALATMSKPQTAAPTAAGAQPSAAPQAAPTAGAQQLPTLTPEQAAAAAPGTEFLTTAGEKRVRH